MGASVMRGPLGRGLFLLLWASLVGLNHVWSHESQKGRHDLRNGSHALLPLVNRMGMLPDDPAKSRSGEPSLGPPGMELIR